MGDAVDLLAHELGNRTSRTMIYRLTLYVEGGLVGPARIGARALLLVG